MAEYYRRTYNIPCHAVKTNIPNAVDPWNLTCTHNEGIAREYYTSKVQYRKDAMLPASGVADLRCRYSDTTIRSTKPPFFFKKRGQLECYVVDLTECPALEPVDQ